jgi:hypothetical protein
MVVRKGLTIGLLIGLAGCATPYRPPTEQPPPEWTGDSGWKIRPDTIRVHEGAHRPGDVLMEYELKAAQTAVVLETVRTKSAYGKDFIIPAGTKLFAENFTLVWRTGWAGQKQVEQAIDPIEWCAVLPNGIDGKQPGSDTACLFWETPTQARYTQGFRNGGFGYHPRMFDTSGMPGPVPKIKVQPVDFGVHIMRQIRVAKLGPARAELESVLSDGTADQVTDVKRLRWIDGRKSYYQDDVWHFELTASEDYSGIELKDLGRGSALPIVRVCVDSAGSLVGEPEIALTSGKPQLDAAAVQIAKKGRYSAGKGKDGPNCFKYKMQFEFR